MNCFYYDFKSKIFFLLRREVGGGGGGGYWVEGGGVRESEMFLLWIQI